MLIPSQTALAELVRRRANAAALVARGALDPARADAMLRCWCAIAAWFGAALPPDLRREGEAASWLSFSPPGMAVDLWRRWIAEELRRAAEEALRRAEQADPPRADLVERARALLGLDNILSIAAGLPAIGAAPQPPQRTAA